MKIKGSFLLVAAFFWLSASAQAQTLTTIKSFSGADGAYPAGGVVLSDGVLYGTTSGWAKMGPTIFRVNTDGTGFRTLYTNLIDGGLYPEGLLVVGNTLYGTTSYGGSEDKGTIFRIDTDGNNFTNLYSFTTNNQCGGNPSAGLVLEGTNFYGTAQRGGAGYGTVFKIDTNGGGYSNLHVFTNGLDGGSPRGGLLLSQGVLYGTAWGGGWGVVFKLNIDGSGFTNLYNFPAYAGGGGPIGRLIISGNTLYGTGGPHAFSGGVVFKVNTDGGGFANLLAPASNNPGLVLLGNTLFGTTADWDYPQANRVYKVNVDGSGPTTVYNFANTVIPQGDLISSGGILYGTTMEGGSGGGGTVFALDPAILLKSAVLNDKIVLSWYDPSFQLQSAPSVSGPYTNIPAATSPYTNAAIFPQQFFRLQQ